MQAKLLYTYQFGQPWRPAPFDVPHGGSVVIESGCLKIYGPVERPAEPWTGGGLPPVGTDCEMYYGPGYEAVRILAHDEDRAVFRYLTGLKKGGYGAATAEADTFRPMRTAEELAREAKLDDLIARFALAGRPSVPWRRLFGQMLDAGVIK